MQKIQCGKCGHIEKVDASEEYTCSTCGGDSYMTIAQEIQNNLTWYTLEEIEDGLWEETILIGATWEECELIEESKAIEWSYDILDMGITVYGLQND